MNELKDLVCEFVKADGITREELAQRLGIGRSALYAKLDGLAPWRLDEAVRLANMLGMPIDELAEMAIKH